MNKKQTNLIDSLPSLSSVGGGKGKSDIPVLNHEVLPQDVLDAVDSFVAGGALKTQAEAQQGEAQPVITAAANRVLDDLADSGSFCKSVKLAGSAGQVTITRTDKFSIPESTTIAQLTEQLGKEFVEAHFITETEVILNPNVLKDNKLLKELIDLVGVSNFGRFFVKIQKTVAQKGLDKDLFDLPEEKRQVVRDGLVKQASASIKLS